MCVHCQTFITCYDVYIMYLLYTDLSLTHENVSTVLATVVELDKLRGTLAIPSSKLKEIQLQSSTTVQERDGLIDYFIKYTEYASWSDLANRLYQGGHHKAVAAAKRFIKQAPGKCMRFEGFSGLLVVSMCSLYYHRCKF